MTALLGDDVSTWLIVGLLLLTLGLAGALLAATRNVMPDARMSSARRTR